MRKLVVWNLMTLDGFFEGSKPWDIDFHNLAWGPELQKYAEQLGEKATYWYSGARPTREWLPIGRRPRKRGTSRRT